VRYQTILVHLENRHVFERPLAYANALAQAQSAHLIGLSVLPALTEIPATTTRVQRLIDEYRLSFRDEAAFMQRQFEKPDAIATITKEWRISDSGFQPQLDAIAAAASGADLIVSSQDDPDASGSGFGGNAGLLVTLSPRPVILTPRQGGPWDPPRRIIVAWNGSAQSARAVFDALPLLTSAQSVTIIAIRSLEGRTNGDLATQLDDLCASLVRHGVNADYQLLVPDDAGEAQTIIIATKRHRADLLVMGGYGRSRLSETIFGGVTRHILAHMPIPVLMSH
jgi:nucleotide-binding universal stress UspA family protein